MSWFSLALAVSFLTLFGVRIAQGERSWDVWVHLVVGTTWGVLGLVHRNADTVADRDGIRTRSGFGDTNPSVR